MTPKSASSSKQAIKQLVLVLDFGAQYSQLIARRVRECKVYCEILPYDTPVEEIVRRQPIGIIFSGGPSSVYEDGAPTCDPRIYDLRIPILGICYGMQLMAYQLGGGVVSGARREYGKTELDVLDNGDLFQGLNPKLICWMSHGDAVQSPPPGFSVIARTSNSPVAAMSNPEKKLYGVQFHPEVVHTPWGIEVIRNFLYSECGCQGLWTAESFVKLSCDAIKKQVGDKSVVCGLSGGIDSATVAALVHRAIGDQLTCIFVNHGLLRKDEAEQVRRTFQDFFNVRLIYVDAEERFLTRLKGVLDPEEKRKIIGEEFVRIFEEEAKKLPHVDYLAQGTLYPDVIESGTKQAAKIKTHHNVGGLPDDMNLKLVEPLRYLFKDEVRRVAEELGLPSEMVWRQPFPGPGLAIRIIGEVTKDRLETLREADDIIVEEIKRAGLYRTLWQAFGVLAPVRSVGVMGDQRTYSYPIILRAVTSEDAMTADWARLPWEVLERISNRVINEVKGVNRLVYDVSSKPPATIEWE
ncbi:MAG TPA: glutamine-hydrolyzing GMP synthase [Armatimonadota bacterium]|nr:glutamine-hydrolyzing GMP synthase [Armatimonadota bacterium]